jgi:hypothetical protein
VKLGRVLVVMTAMAAGAIFPLVASADPPLIKVEPRKAPPPAGKDAGSGPISKTPPDPPQMVEKVQWVFDLRWDKGEPYLIAVNRHELETPQPTPRAMGRFAIELFEGPTLIERVRFDFPGLGPPPPPDAGVRGAMDKNLRTRIGVMFPATRRGTRLELWDRATDQRWALPWPPSPR